MPLEPSPEAFELGVFFCRCDAVSITETEEDLQKNFFL